MPRVIRFFDQISVIFIFTGNKKGSLGIVFIQDLKNLFCIFRGTVIKCQINDLLIIIYRRRANRDARLNRRSLLPLFFRLLFLFFCLLFCLFRRFFRFFLRGDPRLLFCRFLSIYNHTENCRHDNKKDKSAQNKAIPSVFLLSPAPHLQPLLICITFYRQTC